MQQWWNGELAQMLPSAVNVGDGSCIGSSLVGPVLSTPIGLAQGVDRRCYSFPLPQETHGCSFFDPSAQYFKSSVDWTAFESAPPDWTNIPAAPQIVGYLTGCRWEAQCGQLGFVSVKMHLFRVAAGDWYWGLSGLPIANSGAFRYKNVNPWQPFGVNLMTKTRDTGQVPGLPDTISVMPHTLI